MRFSRTCVAAMTLLATPAAALAQEQGRRNRDVFIASGEEDPLSIGDEDVYIDVAPFVEFDAGWSTASRDALIGPGDDQRARIGRGWLFFDYGLGSDVTGLAVVNFSNIDDTPLQYLWIDYQPTDRLTLRFGQQDANFSMQQRMGSRPALFADVAENGTLQAPAAVGVSILYGGDRFSIQAGVEGNDINDSPFGNGINLSGRATVAPWMQGEDAVHLGLAVAASHDRRLPLSYAGSAGTGIVDASPVKTDDFGPRGRSRSANAEAAATFGRFTLQSEYTVLRADATQRPAATLHGGYLGALFFLTGDHRSYSAATGLFERVDPTTSLAQGGAGAVEVGARVGHLDLGDAEPEAGAQTSVAAIVNWYPTKRFRVTATHVRTSIDRREREGTIGSTLLRASFVY